MDIVENKKRELMHKKAITSFCKMRNKAKEKGFMNDNEISNKIIQVKKI